MRVGVIGVNHKLAHLKLREKLAKACQKLLNCLYFNLKDHHFIVLSTCNRTEIYFSSDDLPILHSYLLAFLRQDIEEEFEQKLYSFFGVDCFSHLTKVAAGLDSAILGETEILGQVKVAYDIALKTNPLSKHLHFLFQKSLAIAKKVRTDLQLVGGMPELEHAIFQTGKQYFSNHKKTRLLFIGASDINQKVLGFLKSKNLFEIFLCNRTQAKAQFIADKNKIQMLEWSKLKDWVHYDWIIFGTKSPEYLVHYNEINYHSFNDKKLIIDLSVPRNVDPAIADHPGIDLLNIDEINNKLKAKRGDLVQTLFNAENKINENVHQYALRYLEKEQTKIIHMKVSA